ncbi:MAG: 3-deoxy-D-manno-octulosonic acid kinase [Agarilytica sp.]
MLENKDDIVVQSDFKTSHIGTSVIHYDSQFFTAPSAVPTEAVFTADYWQQANAISGQAQGRGTTWFFKHSGTEMALRHYFRGGLIGKLLTDHYAYSGLHNTRPFREFKLLRHLTALGLPAPYPVAVHVKKRPPFSYTGDIITQKIDNAADLVSLLSKRALTAKELNIIGATIKRFHEHCIYHHDLNAHNILLNDKSSAWLIDFDQGAIRKDGSAWKQQNLDRLKRSFEKEKGRIPSFHWNEQSWNSLIEGYS